MPAATLDAAVASAIGAGGGAPVEPPEQAMDELVTLVDVLLAAARRALG